MITELMEIDEHRDAESTEDHREKLRPLGTEKVKSNLQGHGMSPDDTS